MFYRLAWQIQRTTWYLFKKVSVDVESDEMSEWLKKLKCIIQDHGLSDIFNAYLELPISRPSWFSPFNIEITKFDCACVRVYMCGKWNNCNIRLFCDDTSIHTEVDQPHTSLEGILSQIYRFLIVLILIINRI